MVKDKVYALDAVCSHEGGPLEEGTLEGYEVTQLSYEVKVEDDKILVKEKPKSEEQTEGPPQHELTLLEKKKVEGTDIKGRKVLKH